MDALRVRHRVLNSQKFGIWKPLDSFSKNGKARDKSGEARTKNGQAATEFGRSKEDTAVAAVDTAVKQQPALPLKPEEEVWGFLGINPCGPIFFRVLLERQWSSRNGDRPSRWQWGHISTFFTEQDLPR
jgi:hypothetical protein